MSQNEQQQHEQRIIEDLFGELRQAEHQTGARDPAAGDRGNFDGFDDF